MWFGAEDRGGRVDESFLYLRDRWIVGPELTLNLGLRLSDTEVRGEHAGPSRRVLDPGVTIAPRLGVTWDFEGNGRSRLYAHLGRYRRQVPAGVSNRLFGVEDAGLEVLDPVGELIDSRPVASVWVDPATRAPSFDELLVGADYELLGGVLAGAAFCWRSLNDAVVDASFDGGATIRITNQEGELPTAELEQRSATLFAHRRFDRHWQLATSLSWFTSTGNVELGRESSIEAADSGFLADYASPEALDQARGDLPDDRRWQFTSFGSYTWDRGLSASAAVSYRSGAPLSKLGALSAGRGLDQRFVSQRGSEGRSPGLWTVELRLAQSFRTGVGDIEAWLEIGNPLGSDRAVAIDQRWSVLDELAAADLDESAQRTSDGWGSPLTIQEPRRLEVGLRFGF
jgi:hypothetical protein